MADKRAKEMFVELGYELKEHSKSYLRYKTDIDKIYGEFIDFDLKNQMVRLTRKTCQGNTHFKYGSVKELQAINKQVKELGWEG